MAHYWLLKTEPNTYSFEDLRNDKKTNWDGVRNYQARNFLKEAKKGDLALIYHSGDEKAVMGVAEVSKSAYPDLDPKKKGEWVQIDIKIKSKFKTPVTLKQIKTEKSLEKLPLIKHTRLSVMPVSAKEFNRIETLGQKQ